MIAYCSGCSRYVELTADGVCASGHPRSALRDVRTGPLPAAAVVRPAGALGVREPAPTYRDDEPRSAEPNMIVARLLGWGIVVVPVSLILGWGIWTGMAQFSGSFATKFALSIGSILLTVGGAFLFTRRTKH
jgi:hypothetical protein